MHGFEATPLVSGLLKGSASELGTKIPTHKTCNFPYPADETAGWRDELVVICGLWLCPGRKILPPHFFHPLFRAGTGTNRTLHIPHGPPHSSWERQTRFWWHIEHSTPVLSLVSQVVDVWAAWTTRVLSRSARRPRKCLQWDPRNIPSAGLVYRGRGLIQQKLVSSAGLLNHTLASSAHHGDNADKGMSLVRSLGEGEVDIEWNVVLGGLISE